MTQNKAKKVRLYTDGSCLGTPGPGGWAYVIEYDSKNGTKTKQTSGSESDTTNNRMELLAVAMGLMELKEPCKVDIYTDSRYVKDCLTSWLANWKANNWRTKDKKPVKNQDLIKMIDQFQNYHFITWHWVPGHSGHKQNEICDRLCGAAARELQQQTK